MENLCVFRDGDSLLALIHTDLPLESICQIAKCLLLVLFTFIRIGFLGHAPCRVLSELLWCIIRDLI